MPVQYNTLTYVHDPDLYVREAIQVKDIQFVDKTVDLPVGLSAGETCRHVSAGCSAKTPAEQSLVILSQFPFSA